MTEYLEEPHCQQSEREDIITCPNLVQHGPGIFIWPEFSVLGLKQRLNNNEEA
jgi:hypothetical protein